MIEGKISRKEFVKLLAGLAGLTLIGSKIVGLFDKRAEKEERNSSSYGNGVYGG